MTETWKNADLDWRSAAKANSCFYFSRFSREYIREGPSFTWVWPAILSSTEIVIQFLHLELWRDKEEKPPCEVLNYYVPYAGLSQWQLHTVSVNKILFSLGASQFQSKTRAAILSSHSSFIRKSAEWQTSTHSLRDLRVLPGSAISVCDCAWLCQYEGWNGK